MAETTSAREATLVFEAPGEGSWSLDKGHVPHPATRFHQENVPEPFRLAFQRMFSRYGIPALTNRQELVHGFCFTQLVALPADQFEARAAAAEEALATRRWREDLRRWDEEVKPASIRRHLELVAVDPDRLDDDRIVEHLRTCTEHVRRMIAQHHEFNGATMVPLGDFLAHAGEWTGLDAPALLELFAGASPTSRGECPELDAVRAALAGDAAALDLLAGGGDAAEILVRLRTDASPATSAAVSAWVDLVGHRIVDGFDVDQPRAVERPAVLVSCLRHALEERPDPDVASRLAQVRNLVPEEHRATFDDLYREAHDVYRLRDERGIYSDSGAFGLMRRALLSAGVRLVVAGVLTDATLALEAGTEELVGLLRGAGAPSGDELRDRRTFRARWSVADVPSVLGDPVSPPPPFELLPPGLGRMTRAIVTFSGHMTATGAPSTTAPSDGDGTVGGSSLRGLAASPGLHRGVARLVRGVDDLDRVEPGDVIVAITTGESFNLALSLASAVVTDQGGLLSHAAILAREYGIPAVVGTGDATTLLEDGAVVRVDGSNGVVTW